MDPTEKDLRRFTILNERYKAVIKQSRFKYELKDLCFSGDNFI